MSVIGAEGNLKNNSISAQEVGKKGKAREKPWNTGFLSLRNEDLFPFPGTGHPDQKRRLKAQAKEEKQRYSQLKRLRWTLLTNGARLPDEKAQHLQSVLSDHSDFAVCYAMKEELCALFDLTDPLAAYEGWKRWFDAAEASSIPALVKFAELKRSFLDSLAAMPFSRLARASWRASTTKSRSPSALAIGKISTSLP